MLWFVSVVFGGSGTGVLLSHPEAVHWREHRKWRSQGVWGFHESLIFYSGPPLDGWLLCLCDWSGSDAGAPPCCWTLTLSKPKIYSWSRSLRPARPNQFNLLVTTTGSYWNGGQCAALLGLLGQYAGCGGPRHQDLELSLVFPWGLASLIQQHMIILTSDPLIVQLDFLKEPQRVSVID